MATFAGRYSEDLQDRYGNGFRNAKVAVQTLAGGAVTLYADRTKTAYVPAAGLAANEIKADSKGNLTFFADPGNFQIVVTPVGQSARPAFPVSVYPDPLEPDASQGSIDALVGRVDTLEEEQGDPRPPNGGAGGVLSGTYPDPGFAVDMAEQSELQSEVAARGTADTALGLAITQEATTRGNADIALDARLGPLEADLALPGPRPPTAHGHSQDQITGLVSDLGGKQPADVDLSTIAELDSSQAGAIASDGAGWIRKTYAQLKTALGLVKADVGLANVDNTSDANKPVSTAQQTALDLLLPKALYDANTILAADTDNTPIALTLGASQVLGRKATGGIVAMTMAELWAILGPAPYGSVYGPDPTWLYTGPVVFTPNTLTLPANRGYFYRRFTPAVPISKVAFANTTATGNICVAAYAHDPIANGPGARLATSGSVPCPAGPMSEVSLGATVTPEWLYVGSDSGTVTLRSYNSASGAPAMFSGVGVFQASAFPAPATPAGYSTLADQRAILVGKP